MSSRKAICSRGGSRTAPTSCSWLGFGAWGRGWALRAIRLRLSGAQVNVMQ